MRVGLKATGNKSAATLFVIGIVLAASVALTFLLAAKHTGIAWWHQGEARTKKVPPEAYLPFPKENGAWLWTQPLSMTNASIDIDISAAKENGISVIYLSIDSYLNLAEIKDVQQRDAQAARFDAALEHFITEAHQNGIAVDAEAGAPDWGEANRSKKAPALIAYIETFNSTHKEKFRGIQYDIEPYSFIRFDTDPQGMLYRFIDLVDRTASGLKGSSLNFAVAIPDFYDAATLKKLLAALEEKPGSTLIVMAYHTNALGLGGIIAQTKDEVAAANGTGTAVIIATEVGQTITPDTSLYGKSKADYLAALAAIQSTFANAQSYAGTATDHLEALRAL